MNHDDDFKAFFEQVRQSHVMQISSVDAVMNRIRSAPATEIYRQPAIRWHMRIAALTAAALVLAIFLVPMWPSNDLQAQFRDALAQIKSAHVVWEIERPEGRTPVREVWYQNQVGYCELKGGTAVPVALHTEKHSWTYQPGSKVALQSEPTNLTEALTGMLFGKDVFGRQNRMPALDARIEQDECKAYGVVRQVPKPGDNGVVPSGWDETRQVFWIDAKQLIRRAEFHEKSEGGWHVAMWVSISYDVDVPAGRFEPDFGAGVAVVDANRVLEDRYAVEKALRVVEIGGLRVAIHEVRKCEDGVFFVVSSVRPTETTLRDFPREATFLPNARFGKKPYGHHQIDDRSNINDARLISLGAVAHEDVQLTWWLAIPHRPYYVENGEKKSSPWMDRVTDDHKLEFQSGSVRLPVWIRIDDRRLVAGAGQESEVYENLIVRFRNKDVTTLKDVTRQAYTDMKSLSFLNGPEAKWDPVRKKWISGSPSGAEPPADAVEQERYTSRIQKLVDLAIDKNNTSATRTLYNLGPDGKTLVPVSTEGPAGSEK